MTRRAKSTKHYAPHLRRCRLIGSRRQNGSVKLNAIWVVPKQALILLPMLAEPPTTRVDDLNEAQHSARFTNEDVVWNSQRSAMHQGRLPLHRRGAKMVWPRQTCANAAKPKTDCRDQTALQKERKKQTPS